MSAGILPSVDAGTVHVADEYGGSGGGYALVVVAGGDFGEHELQGCCRDFRHIEGDALVGRGCEQQIFVVVCPVAACFLGPVFDILGALVLHHHAVALDVVAQSRVGVGGLAYVHPGCFPVDEALFLYFDGLVDGAPLADDFGGILRCVVFVVIAGEARCEGECRCGSQSQSHE